MALLPLLGLYALIAVVGDRPIASDESAFLRYAHNLTHGFYADVHSSVATNYLWHGPGLPALLAPLVALGAPLWLMRVLVGAVLLYLTALVFYALARMYVRKRVALALAIASALYLPFIPVDGVYVEPLATLCVVLVIWLMARSFRGGRFDHWWAAAALAVLAMSRIEFGLVLEACLVLSAVWLLVSRRSLMARRSVVATLVALVLCSPWLAYTYSLTHKPFYWGNAGGLSLYWMTAPGSLGDWLRESDAFTRPQLAANRPVFVQVSRLAPLHQDARLQHIAWENIKDHPGHYLGNVLNNIDRLVFNSPYSFTDEKASSMLYAVPNAILLGLVAVAAFVALRVRRVLVPELAPLAAFAVLGFVIHIPVSAYARFVTPLAPAALWLLIVVLGPHLRITAGCYARSVSRSASSAE